MSNKKQIKSTKDNIVQKTSRIPSISYINDCPSWIFQNIDFDGEWGWGQVTKDDLTQLILPKISNFESMKWCEIIDGSHRINVDKICPKAQKRLDQLNLSDVEELFSFRVNAKSRIWGVRVKSMCAVLWWDKDHTVCPSEKRHT